MSTAKADEATEDDWRGRGGGCDGRRRGTEKVGIVSKGREKEGGCEESLD